MKSTAAIIFNDERLDTLEDSIISFKAKIVLHMILHSHS